MTLTDGQHRTWFVASLMPHLRNMLSQQRLTTQDEALEIVMRLHETLIQDPKLGVQQIHVQLKNLCLKMQNLKQYRTALPEVHEEVWCIKCKGQGHDKGHCLVFANYLEGGGLMLLIPEAQVGTSAVPSLWCSIFQIGRKHAIDNFHLLQKYTLNLQQLFCNFCRSVRHDEHTYRSYELMMDRTPSYRVQAETWPLD